MQHIFYAEYYYDHQLILSNGGPGLCVHDHFGGRNLKRLETLELVHVLQAVISM